MSVLQDRALDAMEAYARWVNDEDHPWRAFAVFVVIAFLVTFGDAIQAAI